LIGNPGKNNRRRVKSMISEIIVRACLFILKNHREMGKE
jgi:hypothetical protein